VAAKIFHTDGRTDITKLTVPFAILRTRLKTSYVGVLSVQPNLEDKCLFLFVYFDGASFEFLTRTTLLLNMPRDSKQAFVLTFGTVMDDVPVRQGFLPFLYFKDPLRVCETYGPLQRNVSLNE